MMVVIRAMMLGSALAMAGAAAAQNFPPPNDQTIVVTGKRNATQDVRDFVRALTPTPVGGQLSRFEQSVCPVAVGLTKRQKDSLAARMRRVAREVGIAVGGKDCVANVVVIVTQDKNALLKELRRRHPQYFGDLPARKIRALMDQPGPAVAWQLQGPPLTARGTELGVDPGLGLYLNRTTEAASRIEAAARPQFDGAVVVIERRSLADLTVTQLADYAAMRAFAGTDPSRLGPSGIPTILRILEAPAGSEIPLSLTQWDFQFLRSFYSVPRNLNAGAQRATVGRTMEKQVERSEASDPAPPPRGD